MRRSAKSSSTSDRPTPTPPARIRRPQAREPGGQAAPQDRRVKTVPAASPLTETTASGSRSLAPRARVLSAAQAAHAATISAIPAVEARPRSGASIARIESSTIPAPMSPSPRTPRRPGLAEHHHGRQDREGEFQVLNDGRLMRGDARDAGEEQGRAENPTEEGHSEDSRSVGLRPRASDRGPVDEAPGGQGEGRNRAGGQVGEARAANRAHARQGALGSGGQHAERGGGSERQQDSREGAAAVEHLSLVYVNACEGRSPRACAERRPSASPPCRS
jgi:hypothetical protein